tara:strand:- start:1539 stop:2033 length:495 start_codon:yes stop_codon:yes gene_type:complete
MNQKILKETILSDAIVNQIISSERWGIFHGSHIIEYFIDNDMEFEYANSALRKKIIKQYILKKINVIFNDIKEENPEILYRSVYLNDEPKNKANFGIYWSSKPNTSPCIQYDSGIEYLLKIKFNNNDINWINTILSRLDYIHGDREKEYQLYDKEVSLISFEKV